MKRFSPAIIIVAICALALPLLVSVSDESVWQYHYYDYYFDSQGNMMGFGYSILGELDDDVATDRAYIGRFHMPRSDGSWDSLTIYGYYYEKNEDGEWVYWGGSWLEWSVIEAWFNNSSN